MAKISPPPFVCIFYGCKSNRKKIPWPGKSGYAVWLEFKLLINRSIITVDNQEIKAFYQAITAKSSSQDKLRQSKCLILYGCKTA